MSLYRALAHAELGRRIIPFRLTRTSATKWRKVPLVKWQQAATTDRATIDAWWTKWPDATPGWVLDDGYIVADVDDWDAFEATGLELPETARQETVSGGSHLLYRYDGTARQSVKDVDGLDTRVGGSGWVALYADDAFEGDVAEAPEWLLTPHDDRAAAEPRAPGDDRPIGTRQEIVTLAGRLRSVGASREAIAQELLVRLADGRIESYDAADPWTREHLLFIANDMGSKPVVEFDLAGAASMAGNALATATTLPGARQDEPRDEAPDEPTHDADEAAAVAWRALREVDGSTPPPPLIGRISEEGQTILFGMGGTGKGTVAADWIVQLLRSDPRQVVLVLDFESHAGEWRRRVGQFDAGDAIGALDRTFVIEPYQAGLKSIIDPKTQRVIADAITATGATLLVIDSIVMACGASDSLDAKTAGMYSAVIQQFGLPGLHLGHSTKDDGKDAKGAKYPFGSIFWHNWARMTWGLYRTNEDDDSAPRKLANRKSSNAVEAKPEQIDWEWVTGDLPPVHGLEYSPFTGGKLKTRELILLAVQALARDGVDEPTTGMIRSKLAQLEPDLEIKPTALSNALEDSTDIERVSKGVWRLVVSYVDPMGTSFGSEL